MNQHNNSSSSDESDEKLATYSSPPFPACGWIHGVNTRHMIPLVCQRAGKPNSRALNIWFFVGTGSPFTCLSLKSLEVLLGPGKATNSFHRISIQDQERKIECQVSKAHYQKVNLLGADAMRDLELSIFVDWKKKRFQLSSCDVYDYVNVYVKLIGWKLP